MCRRCGWRCPGTYWVPPFLWSTNCTRAHQSGIRAQLRSGFVTVIALLVVYFILSRMGFWVLVHTTFAGLIAVAAAFVGLAYVAMRRFF